LPATYRGTRIGALSEITAFSFYATKTLTTGEGGMLTTDNDGYAERMSIMRLHGISRDAWKRYSAQGTWYYDVVEAGFKYNFTDLQAALGTVQLRKCDLLHERRRQIAASYTRAFQSLQGIEPLAVTEDRDSAWHLYVVRVQMDQVRVTRDQLIEELRKRGIGTSVHFIPLHLHPYYRASFGYKRGDLPVAEKEYARCLSLPIYPDMTEDEVQLVIEAVSDIMEQNAL